MEDLNWSKTSIYDDLYGYIKLSNVELDIIDHPLFQRLNYVRQLGNAFRVFPGAQHTRFSHSLGVMHLIDRIITSGNIGDIETEERQKLRLAALLHDIGHYPYSHAIETIYTDDGKLKEGKHENFGEYVLINYGINKILKCYGYDAREISKIFLVKSDKVIYNQLISSQFDVDRCDYLLRDSKNTGVKYGHFDLDRLFHTLTVSNNEHIGIKEKGVRAADDYIIGRYLMWTTVYTHKTISGYDELLKACFRSLTPKKFSSINELQGLSEEELIKFNDNYILNLIYKNVDNEDKYVSKICKMYSSRNSKNRLKIVDKEEHYSLENKRSEKYFQLNQYGNKNIMERLEKRDDSIKGFVFHSNASSKLPSLKPINYIETKSEDKEEKNREETKSLYLIDDEKEESIYGIDTHSLGRYLINLSYDVVRIYTIPNIIDKVSKELSEDIEENIY